ncbi:hypothetical protein [Agromyces humatus]|uniref:Uncharacterized protein n=1 Tax=Agromyces humatus TaxID=279573 RepID=A0ABN2KZ10_9MICO|nr:hypothetical protein [Agromyces humatus]
MTDSTARIDPRYDPRFQRGYVGSETDAPPHAASPQPESPVVAPVPVTREPREQVEARPARFEPERSQAPRDDVHRGVPSPFVPPADRVPGAQEPGGGAESAAAEQAAVFAEVEPDDPESARYARAWLIAGWLFSVAILFGGLWWAWNAAIDPRYYTGFGGSDSDMFLYLQWSVPPAMVMIGGLGAVVVTTFAGMHQLAASRRQAQDGAVDRDADRAPSAFPRVPTAYVLIAIAVIGFIATYWLAGLIGAGQSVMWTESGPPAGQLTTVALSRVGDVGLAPISATAFAAVIGLVLLGVQSARPQRAARRAT